MRLNVGIVAESNGRRETGSLRWPLFLFGYMTTLAWLASLLARPLGTPALLLVAVGFLLLAIGAAWWLARYAVHGSAKPLVCRAIVAQRHGGPEVLAVREWPVPQPGRGEVRLRVEAVHVLHRVAQPPCLLLVGAEGLSYEDAAEIWPAIAETWALVMFPAMALVSEETTTYISAGHLLLGYTMLGVILAVRPELTGAGD